MNDLKVYRFGPQWHWRCDRGGTGRCLGGPKHTQPEAFAAAQQHYNEEHRASDEAQATEYAKWVAENGEGGVS